MTGRAPPNADAAPPFGLGWEPPNAEPPPPALEGEGRAALVDPGVMLSGSLKAPKTFDVGPPMLGDPPPPFGPAFKFSI